MIVIVELDILIDIVTDCYKAFNRENRLEYNSILKSNSSIVSELYMVIVVIVDIIIIHIIIQGHAPLVEVPKPEVQLIVFFCAERKFEWHTYTRVRLVVVSVPMQLGRAVEDWDN